MNKEELKQQVLHQSGEALGQFLATSMVAIVHHDEHGLNDYGSGTCVYYRDQYLIMTAAHVIEDIPKENLTLVYTKGRIDLDVQIEVGYPDVVKEAATHQHVDVPDVEGMSGRGGFLTSTQDGCGHQNIVSSWELLRSGTSQKNMFEAIGSGIGSSLLMKYWTTLNDSMQI